ncbi:hypothetical protein ACFQY7_39145 [Actinomadura luteofluorescens]
MIGAAAVRRGHRVLMFTGPGQGSALREHGMPFTAEWERPTRAVLDWLGGLVEPRLLVGVGISFGGHLLARAAAFEPRYDGVVLYDYFPGMLTARSCTTCPGRCAARSSACRGGCGAPSPCTAGSTPRFAGGSATRYGRSAPRRCPA